MKRLAIRNPELFAIEWPSCTQATSEKTIRIASSIQALSIQALVFVQLQPDWVLRPLGARVAASPPLEEGAMKPLSPDERTWVRRNLTFNAPTCAPLPSCRSFGFRPWP